MASELESLGLFERLRFCDEMASPLGFPNLWLDLFGLFNTVLVFGKEGGGFNCEMGWRPR
jgi:hypothetical protein